MLRTSWLSARVPLLIALLAAAYSAAMFRGLENHPGYYGSAYQVLYPQAFPGDPFMAADRPVMLSLYYFLVKIVGPLWLDDRFTFLIFFAMTVLSLMALDKMARLFGCRSFWERSALMALVLLEHKLHIVHVLLVDNYGFNATALGGVAAVWLLYGALAGWGAARQLPLAILGMAISPKNCWLPVLMAAALFWKDRLGHRGKLRALAAAGLVGVGGLIFYYARLRPADGSDVALFDYILRVMDNQEADPFLYPLRYNLLFGGFCLAGFLPLGLPTEVMRRVRVVAAMGLLVWLASGLYLSYAPDALKIPPLVPFDPRRALRWPTYILFAAFGAALLKRFQEAPSSRGVVLSGLGFFGLYLAHLELRWNLLILVGLAAAGMLAFYRRLSPASLSPEQRLRLAAVPAVLGTLGLYSVGAVHHRWATLGHLARYGIVGDNPTAKWTGINEYIRRETPPSATVLALTQENALRQPAPLGFDGSLRARTGRAMPFGHAASFYLDYAKLRWWEERSREVKDLAAGWEREDARAVSEGLRRLGPPSYLIVPTAKSLWAERSPALGYRVETRIRDFTIFRLAHGDGGA